MKTSKDQPLRRYGEFTRRNGPLVEEPRDFAREKQRLSLMQQTWIKMVGLIYQMIKQQRRDEHG
jgi:hypothetical protein